MFNKRTLFKSLIYLSIFKILTLFYLTTESGKGNTRIRSEKSQRSLVGTHLEWVSLSDRIETVASIKKTLSHLLISKLRF
jgi:hypothetical protein